MKKKNEELERMVNELFDYVKSKEGTIVLLAVSEKEGFQVEAENGKKANILGLITACLHELLKEKRIDKEDIKMVYKLAVGDTNYVSGQIKECLDKMFKG